MPDALLLISTHCPHCPAALQSLGDLVKRGALDRLEVVNVERRPEMAAALGVRSVPWARIGEFELAGVRPDAEWERWVQRAGRPEGMSEYLHALLKEGQLPRVLEVLAEQPERLSALLPILTNPEASINVRIGAGAVFEDFEAHPALQALIPELVTLARHPDRRVRADACHTLSLSAEGAACPALEAALADPDAEVREIAADSLDSLRQRGHCLPRK